MATPHIQQIRLESSPELQILIRRYHNAFILLTVIAQRARRTRSDMVINLAVGEALIGDHETYGMTKQQYRVAKSQLERFKLAAFRGTPSGTIATLCNNAVYDINADGDNTQDNTPTTHGQHTDNT